MKNLFFILAIITLLHISVKFVPDIHAWNYYAFVKQLETALLCFYTISLIPYRDLAVKSVLSIWFITELIDSVDLLYWIAFSREFPIHLLDQGDFLRPLVIRNLVP